MAGRLVVVIPSRRCRRSAALASASGGVSPKRTATFAASMSPCARSAVDARRNAARLLYSPSV
jgi:hypothetical protein